MPDNADNDFYTPTDIDVLRMENELLAFEVRFLKARQSRSGMMPGSSTSLNRMSRLEQAETDLKLLLGRMSRSPLGPVLRRSGNYRTLEQLYLESPEPRESYRLEYLERAQRDLVLLLKRMGHGPQARLLRLNKNFRTLEQKYL